LFFFSANCQIYRGDFDPSEAFAGLTFGLEGSLVELTIAGSPAVVVDLAIGGSPAADVDLATKGNRQVLIVPWADLGTLGVAMAHKILLKCWKSWGADAMRIQDFQAGSTMVSSPITVAYCAYLALKITKRQTLMRSHKKESSSTFFFSLPLHSDFF
jgi:hypothetical protein